jgi:hypothetical protein
LGGKKGADQFFHFAHINNSAMLESIVGCVQCVKIWHAIIYDLIRNGGRTRQNLDARELLMASDALAKILPSLAEPPSEQHLQDPREVMFKIYMEMRERGEVPPEGWYQHRINGLEAEVAALKAQLTAGGLVPVPPIKTRVDDKPTLASQGIDPTEVVPPSEWRGETYARRGPDDPPKRSSQVIEGKANPPAAGAPAKPAWQDWLDSGGYGGPGFDRWSNRNGA